jgi:hypothetical protein
MVNASFTLESTRISFLPALPFRRPTIYPHTATLFAMETILGYWYDAKLCPLPVSETVMYLGFFNDEHLLLFFLLSFTLRSLSLLTSQNASHTFHFRTCTFAAKEIQRNQTHDFWRGPVIQGAT